MRAKMSGWRLLSLAAACLIALALWPAAAGAAHHAPAGVPGYGQDNVAREDFTIDFGDFQSSAELTYPSGASGPAPGVLLIPGSGPEDLNADIFSYAADGTRTLISHNFADIATYLSSNGLAVLRYSKHDVTGPGTYQQGSMGAGLETGEQDAEKALATLESDPHVDASRVFVYGWSEGSVVAANLVAMHPDVSGLVFQGAVAKDFHQLFLDQFTQVSVPYLRRFAQDGNLTVNGIFAAVQGPGGLVAKELAFFLVDPSSTPDNPLLNPAFDTNGDGVISIGNELLPNLDPFLSTLFEPGGPFRIYSSMLAIPTAETLARDGMLSSMPVLILQGANDANTAPEGAQLLAQTLQTAGNTDVALHIYPGLGHSLGPASDPIDDNFRPIDAQPLVNLLAWLQAHAG